MKRAEIEKNSKSLTERAEAATTAGLRVKKRVRAAILDVLGEIAADTKWREKLKAQAMESPLSFLERALAFTPKDAEPAAAAPALNVHMAFLDAVRGAAPSPVPIEATPRPVLELEAHKAEPEPTDW